MEQMRSALERVRKVCYGCVDLCSVAQSHGSPVRADTVDQRLECDSLGIGHLEYIANSMCLVRMRLDAAD